MAHLVSLHFENPFKDSTLDRKIEALDIPLSQGDYVEIVGIWRNEDGSIGMHVEVIEEPNFKQKSPVQNNNVVEQGNHDQDHLTLEETQRIPSDDLTKAGSANDDALDLTPDLQEAEEELEEDFEDAAEHNIKRDVEKSYEKQREPQSTPQIDVEQ